MAVTFEKQLLVRSIIDELVRPDGDAFSIEKARILRDFVLVDYNAKPSSGFRSFWASPSSTSQSRGFAAGVGNVSMDSKDEKLVQFGFSGRIFCGNWQLTLVHNYIPPTFSIWIERKFNETRQLEQREDYYLKLDRNNEPMQLMEETLTIFNFFDLRVAFPRRRFFKRPVPGPTHD
jgi:hypothetical protein